jgi:hypothetical protein
MGKAGVLYAASTRYEEKISISISMIVRIYQVQLCYILGSKIHRHLAALQPGFIRLWPGKGRVKGG